MPFEVMDHRGSTAASSHYFDDIHFPSERQIGFWKPNVMPDQQVGMDGKIDIPSGNCAASLPMERYSSCGPLPMHHTELSRSILARDPKEKSLISEGSANTSKHAWSSMDHHPKPWSSLSMQPASYSTGRSRVDISGTQWESSLFSSSFSEIFNRKLIPKFNMEGGNGSEVEREEDDSVSDILQDRFRLSAVSIAENEAKKNGVEISEPITSCIADLALNYTEQLAKELEVFAQHAGRKSVNMEDVILSAHRNEHLTALLRSFCNDLKEKEPQSERKRRKTSKKEDKSTTSVVNIPDT